MTSLYVSGLLNILLMLAFIADRVFRLRSIKEYREAKDAQIETLRQQLEVERNNNDVCITEMHKRRYENLKVLLDEKELALNKNGSAFRELQTALQDNKEKKELLELLVGNLNKLEKEKQDLEREKKALTGEPY